jgi:phosphoglycolate phosphatase-like HAD superfamily hydrolase
MLPRRRCPFCRLKLEPDECVYVGDTPEDLAMAKAVGMRAIAMMGPFPVEKRLREAKPEFLLERLADLPQLLQRLFPNSGTGEKKRTRRGKRR